MGLHSLAPATEQEIHQVIINSPTKSCEMDPLPTHLLKQCLDELAPVITCIVNKSLVAATLLASLKHATVKPLLKKPRLDTNEFNNFRPISNLKFLSKLIEKIVVASLDHHMDLHQLRDPL